MDSARSGLPSNSGFFKRDDVGGPGLAGEKGHLTKEITFVKNGYVARPAVLSNLNLDPAVMHNEHRRSLIAGADNHLTRRKDVTGGSSRKPFCLFGGERGKNLYCQQTVDHTVSVFRRAGRRHFPFDVNRSC